MNRTLSSSRGSRPIRLTGVVTALPQPTGVFSSER